jgi:actin-related protein
MDHSESAVVIDNGSGFIKAGMSGEDCPRVIQPTLIGVPRMPGIMVGMDQKEYYVGHEAVDKARFLNMSEPVVSGYIDKWEDMSKIWTQIFQDLNISSKENPLFFADTPLTPRSAREKMAEVMFEEFETPFLYMYTGSVLSLFASGRTTGLVVDSGEGRTHAVPIYEGFALPHGILKLDISGKNITDMLEDVLKRSKPIFASGNYRSEVVKIKEQFCMVASDFDILKKTAEESGEREEYKLPDGSSIMIGIEKYMCPEILFSPSHIGKNVPGLADTVFKAISSCDANIKKELYANIVLAGGNCMLKRLGERLHKDVKALAPSTMPAEVCSPPERAYSAWLGGSILANIDSFKPMFISKAEYIESGALIVYKKCF